jgi:ribonuclease HI
MMQVKVNPCEKFMGHRLILKGVERQDLLGKFYIDALQCVILGASCSDVLGDRMIKAYTDGGCHLGKNLGYGAVIICNGMVTEYSDNDAFGGVPTAPRAELLGVLLALRNISSTESIEIVTDSQLTINIVNSWMHYWERNGWRKKGNSEIKNLDIIKQIFELKKGLQLRLSWVKGHSGNKWNERADELASLRAKTHKSYSLVGDQQELIPDMPREIVIPKPPKIIDKSPIECELSEFLTKTMAKISFRSNTDRDWASKIITYHYNNGRLSERQIQVAKDICIKYGKSISF